MHKVSCGRRHCGRTRSEFGLLFRGARIPRVHGQSFCSRACLELYIDSTLTEQWSRLHAPRIAGHRRMRLGAILLQDNAVTAQQLQEALELQSTTESGRVGEWLVKLGYLDEHQVTRALSRQSGFPCLSLVSTDDMRRGEEFVPRVVARLAKMVPIGLDQINGCLRLAMVGPAHLGALEALRRMLDLGVEPYIADDTTIEALLTQRYGPVEIEGDIAGEVVVHERFEDIAMVMTRDACTHQVLSMHFETIDDHVWVSMNTGEGRVHRFHRVPGSLPTPGMLRKVADGTETIGALPSCA